MATRLARITTRGTYDLESGAIREGRSKDEYRLYPKKWFEGFFAEPEGELAIVIHGMRNNPSDALSKFAMAAARLRELGYAYPTVGFSYDANVRGAHLRRTAGRAGRAAIRVARSNGHALASLVMHIKRESPRTRIRMIGHSLGSVIMTESAKLLSKRRVGRGSIESMHFFGASVGSPLLESGPVSAALRSVVSKKIMNYYFPGDCVLRDAYESGEIGPPAGLTGFDISIPKYVQKRVRPENHRFVSYMATLRSYP